MVVPGPSACGCGGAGIEVRHENQVPERFRSHRSCHGALTYRGGTCVRSGYPACGGTSVAFQRHLPGRTDRGYVHGIPISDGRSPNAI